VSTKRRKINSSETTTGLNMSKKKKAANVQRKTVKDLQKGWRTIAEDHFRRLNESLAAWKQNIK